MGGTLQEAIALGQPVAAGIAPTPDTPPEAAPLAPQPLSPKPSLPTDRSALGLVAHGVEMTESRGQQLGKDGKTLTSSAGAKGVMQLMPQFFPGVNVDDEAANRTAGTNHLGQLFDKYGNWNDSLAAYDAGPERVDKWIADGRPESGKGALPAETQNYVPTVLARVGMVPSAASDVLSRKRAGSLDEAIEAGKALAPTTPGQSDDSMSYEQADPFGIAAAGGIDTSAFATGAGPGDEHSALLSGAYRGVRNLVAGPVQAAAELVSPEASGKLTATLNADPLSYNSATEKHPAFAMTGEALGVGAALLATRGMLGAFTPAAAVLKTLPLVVRGALPALGGATMGATTYNTDPEHTSRLVEGALGAVAGELGRSVGNAATWAVRKLSDKATYEGVLGLYRDGVDGLSRNSAEPLANFKKYIGGLWAQNNRNYAGRQLAGRGFEGFDSAGLRDVVEGYANDTRVAGVAVSPTAKTHANRVYEELGLKEDDARRAAYEQEKKEYDAALTAWQKKVPKFSKNAEYQEGIIQRKIDNGSLEPPPVAPTPYAPQPIKPEQYSAALTAANRGLRTSKDAATTHQLTAVKRGLEQTAATEAAQLGVSVPVFLRKTAEANRFYQDNIAPLSKAMGLGTTRGSLTPARIGAELTPAKFYDHVVKTIEGGDAVELAALAKAVGSKGRDDVKRIAMFKMLDAGTEIDKPFDPAKALKWVKENNESLRTVFGRDGVESLLGWGKIAQRVVGDPSRFKRLMTMGTHSVLPWLGALQIGHAAFSAMTGAGHAGAHLAEGVGMIASPIALHGLFSVFAKMDRVPAILPMVRAASKLPADSPKLDEMIRVIGAKYRAYGSIASRELPSAYAGPETSPF
jgi:hypothetical protein